jgi:aminoglycoside phosphotransferase (APT) family kinase protein
MIDPLIVLSYTITALHRCTTRDNTSREGHVFLGTVIDVTVVDATDDETPLTGGRWTAGVVRVGDTVRRRPSPSSAFVADLLGHVHRAGFDGCPRYLGRDEVGRDMFSYIAGEVVPRWRRLDDAGVVAAGELLRRWHDATRGFRGHDVVCHHDPGPNNAIFAAGRPVAWIDFDFAAPGDPIEDVAYVAWSWCTSGRPDRGPVLEQARQIRLVADAYDLRRRDRLRLVPAIHERLIRNIAVWQAVAAGSREPAADHPDARLRANEVIAWTRSEQRYITRNGEAIAAALMRPPASKIKGEFKIKDEPWYG